jgi:CubicO group peptidase (beta-lactamase class C family)
MIKRRLFLGGAAGLPWIATAATPDLGSLIEPIREKHKLPALAAGIVTRGGLQDAAVTGVRKTGGTTVATVHDLWHFGSNTKAMTASVMATLVEEGKIHWEDPLSALLPGIGKRKTTGLGSATVRQLLTHRSGVVANVNWEAIAARGGPVTKQRLAALDEAMANPLAHPPGTGLLYSNVGDVIAGVVMEQLTGQPWEKLIQERLFSPLGMSHAGFGGIGTPGKEDQPWPHREDGSPMPSNGPAVDNPPVLGPAGVVHGTLADWSKFIADHLKGARQEQALLKPASYAELHRPVLEDYAMGWLVVERPWAGGTALTHNGSNTMNFSVAWLAPRKDFAVVVCTNRGLQAVAADEVASAVIRAYL